MSNPAKIRTVMILGILFLQFIICATELWLNKGKAIFNWCPKGCVNYGKVKNKSGFQAEGKQNIVNFTP
ncbi:MAG: hypothetical protein KGM98_01650 [Bacteroidota bacterium]|nr:hypothetical protein [Bacteroidota bacterium]